MSFARNDADEKGLNTVDKRFHKFKYVKLYKGCNSYKFGYYYFRNNYSADLEDRENQKINLKLKFKNLSNVLIRDV